VKKLGERGNVLLYTLVGAIVATVLAVSLVQMLLSRASASAKITAQTAAQRQAESALSSAFSAWSAGGVCSPITGYSCSGSCTAGTCGCTYVPTGCTCIDGGTPAAPTAGTKTDPGRCPGAVVAVLSGGSCAITAKTCP
jgi:Tfp pilus assembly protein PilX